MSDPPDERRSDDQEDPRSTDRPRRSSPGSGRRSGPNRSRGPNAGHRGTARSDRHDPADGEGSGRGRTQRRGRSNEPTARVSPPQDSPPRDREDPSARSGWATAGQYAFDIASSVLIVAAVGGFLFAASGVWPPLVAIESGSMEPHIQEGDLVFVMEEQRFPGDGARAGSGIVTAHAGQGTDYRTFEGYGDVIIFQPDGSDRRTPIIHRAMFWVTEGENWADRADPSALSGSTTCEALTNCPAPHAGFITKGDNNQHYDQVSSRTSGPVKPAWIMGTAEVRVPLLGEVRLLTGETSATDGQPANWDPVPSGS